MEPSTKKYKSSIQPEQELKQESSHETTDGEEEEEEEEKYRCDGLKHTLEHAKALVEALGMPYPQDIFDFIQHVLDPTLDHREDAATCVFPNCQSHVCQLCYNEEDPKQTRSDCVCEKHVGQVKLCTSKGCEEVTDYKPGDQDTLQSPWFCDKHLPSK